MRATETITFRCDALDRQQIEQALGHSVTYKGREYFVVGASATTPVADSQPCYCKFTVTPAMGEIPFNSLMLGMVNAQQVAGPIATPA